MLLDRPLSAVTPTLDGDVLAVLGSVDVDTRMTTGQIGRVLNGYSGEGIRRVLARLTSQGVVLREQVGNAGSYRLNPDHLAADAVRSLVNSRERLLSRLTDLIDAWRVQPLFAAVFGSAVRGRMRLDSDIDLLVVHRDDDSQLEWDTQILDVMLSVPRWTGNRAELVVMTEAELHRRGRDRLLEDVRMLGVRVGGDRQWFEHHLRSAGKY